MSSCRRQSVFAITLIICLSVAALAQRTTGTLRGQVLDPQGAVIGSATVTVTNEDTGVSQVVATSSAGTWNLPAVLPGKYAVTIQASCFSTLPNKTSPS